MRDALWTILLVAGAVVLAAVGVVALLVLGLLELLAIVAALPWAALIVLANVWKNHPACEPDNN